MHTYKFQFNNDNANYYDNTLKINEILSKND